MKQYRGYKINRTQKNGKFHAKITLGDWENSAKFDTEEEREAWIDQAIKEHEHWLDLMEEGLPF